MLLNMGLSGQSVVGADVGGFSGSPSPELMARWLQLATFYPFCRNHTAQDTPPQEIWRFGEEVEAIGRSCLQLRYSLLPYLYTLAWEAGRTGLALMRPLLLEFPEDPSCRTEAVAATQFMVGSALLAAPVLHPGRKNRGVYLPPAEYWEDWWTGERFEGSQRIIAAAPLSRLPLYVRAGSALPMTAPALNSEESASLPLSWRIYPAAEIAGTLYLDDGVSMGYQRGLYSLLELRGHRSPEGGSLSLERTAGSLEPPLGRHSGLTLELRSAGEERFAVDPRRLPGEWSFTSP
jgi:alpha-glucosidase